MDAANWDIDTTHSRVSFSVRHLLVSKVRGRFTRWSGKVSLDEAELTRSSVVAELDASSIDTGMADRDAQLRSRDLLDVERFPKVTFKSKRIEQTGRQRYRVVGDLTIRDVTREVKLDAAYKGQNRDRDGNPRAAFSAKTSLDRTEFGLQWNQLLEAGGVLVGDKIDVELEVQAIKTSSNG